MNNLNSKMGDGTPDYDGIARLREYLKIANCYDHCQYEVISGKPRAVIEINDSLQEKKVIIHKDL
jgi:hypothetical protein